MGASRRASDEDQQPELRPRRRDPAGPHLPGRRPQPGAPIGRHRYFFTLYALDATLPDLGRPTRAALLAAMDGHVLAQAELVGTCQKA